MNDLHEFMSEKHSRVTIDFTNPCWHASTKIPPIPGWYYIETNAPFEVLARQSLWIRQYNTKKAGKLAKVKNYDLQARCARFDSSLEMYWNVIQVYSGLTSNLKSRAREHTFPDPGTGGLALSKYPELHEFDWYFCYRSLEEFMQVCPNPGVLLLLGEQVWRSQNGWPILCAE